MQYFAKAVVIIYEVIRITDYKHYYTMKRLV